MTAYVACAALLIWACLATGCTGKSAPPPRQAEGVRRRDRTRLALGCASGLFAARESTAGRLARAQIP